jgi:queuine/archaeosine tRNA-ribosyltransferase
MTDCLALWLGEDGSRIVQDHSSDDVMDSAIYYLEDENPKVGYKFSRLFLDNGAYSANRKGIDLEREKVIELQEAIWPNFTIPLDFPFRSGETVEIMRNKWAKTVENIIYWQSSTRLIGRLAPALHGWSRDSLKKNAEDLQKNADTEMICLGSLVNEQFMKRRFYFGDRVPSEEFVLMLHKTIEIVKRNTNFKIHIMGCGSSPLSLHLAYWLGADSVDSSGHRRRAAYGNIILPGTSDRYIGGREGKFVKRRVNERERRLMSECNCLACRRDPQLIWQNWEARAIHNRYVIKNERNKAEEWRSQGRKMYEEKLESMYRRSGSYHLWRLARMLVKYSSLRSSDISK